MVSLCINNYVTTEKDINIATIGIGRYGDASHLYEVLPKAERQTNITVTIGAMRKSNTRLVRNRSCGSNQFPLVAKQI